MYELEEINWTNITWGTAQRLAFLYLDGCRSNELRVAFIDPKYRFTDLPEDVSKDSLSFTHRLALGFMTRSCYLEHFLQPGKTTYVLRDRDTDTLVASAAILRPEYMDVPRPSLCVRLWASIYKRLCSVRQFLLTGKLDDVVKPAAMLRVYDFEEAQAGLTPSPRLLAELQQMTYNQTKSANYPLNATYHLERFTTKTTERGKGLAREVLNQALRSLYEEGIVKPTGWDGPAKIEFFSSPEGRGFYVKYGFHIGAEFSSMLETGMSVNHTMFYMNLD